jgi:hypothetical protein
MHCLHIHLNGSLVISNKLKLKYKFRATASLFFYSLYTEFKNSLLSAASGTPTSETHVPWFQNIKNKGTEAFMTWRSQRDS